MVRSRISLSLGMRGAGGVSIRTGLAGHIAAYGSAEFLLASQLARSRHPLPCLRVVRPMLRDIAIMSRREQVLVIGHHQFGILVSQIQPLRICLYLVLH